MPENNYYQVLEVQHNASQEQIKEAYYILIKFYHPDRFAPDSAEWKVATEKLKQVNVAYDTLKDPAKRAEYDRLQGLKPSSGDPATSPDSFTPEQQKLIEQNQQRYRIALCAQPLRQFYESMGLEDARRKALADLRNYELGLAKELLIRFGQAAGQFEASGVFTPHQTKRKSIWKYVLAGFAIAVLLGYWDDIVRSLFDDSEETKESIAVLEREKEAAEKKAAELTEEKRKEEEASQQAAESARKAIEAIMPSAKIQKVWAEFDVYEKRNKGMRVNIEIEIKNYKGRDCNGSDRNQVSIAP